MDFILALIIIATFAAGWTLHYFKSRLDHIEQTQHEMRLPYAVAEDTEDIIAIQARATRQLREVGQTINDLGLFIDAMANETERTAEKAKQIRQNGQRKGNGK